jgi:predicted DNA-binding transcriptional regulator YafY
MRALRLSAILDARLADENFQRLTDFDLVEFWKGWRQDRQASYPVHLRVAPQFAPRLTAYLGQAGRAALAQAAPADAQGWVTIELSFASLEAARSRLLAFGGAVEVLAPRALRLSVQDYARQILRRYQPD